jgi:hypothetical protein
VAEIIEFVRPDYVFDSEAAAVIVAAYDQAILSLDNKGQCAAAREVVAKCIIKLAAVGERNPDELCRAALASFGISH